MQKSPEILALEAKIQTLAQDYSQIKAEIAQDAAAAFAPTQKAFAALMPKITAANKGEKIIFTPQEQETLRNAGAAAKKFDGWAAIFSPKMQATFATQINNAKGIQLMAAKYAPSQAEEMAKKIASKSTDKRTLYFVEALQKKGLTIKQFMDLGPTVTNLSNSHIFYKPENDTDRFLDGQAFRVEAGNMLFTSFDGLATELYNDQVYKVSNLNKLGSLGLVILPGGYPVLGLTNSPLEAVLPLISWFGLDGTGWKDRAWQENINARNWNALFAAASTF